MKHELSHSSPTPENHHLKSLLTENKEDLRTSDPVLFINTSNSIGEKLKSQYLNLSNHFQNIQLHFFEADPELDSTKEIIQSCIQNDTHTLISITDNDDSLWAEILTTYKKLQTPVDLAAVTSGAEKQFENLYQKKSGEEKIWISNYLELGVQLQLCTPKHLQELDHEHFEYHRLGWLKRQLKEAEPILRDVQTCVFDLNALKKSDFPSKSDHNPSGFTSEEALQILKYLAISPKMSCILLSGFMTSSPHPDSVSVDWLSQALWYVTHGCDVRWEESPYQLEDMKEFVIQLDHVSLPISFLQSKKTERWWLKIPTSDSKDWPFTCFACSYRDFKIAQRGQLPERLLKAVERVRPKTP